MPDTVALMLYGKRMVTAGWEIPPGATAERPFGDTWNYLQQWLYGRKYTAAHSELANDKDSCAKRVGTDKSLCEDKDLDYICNIYQRQVNDGAHCDVGTFSSPVIIKKGQKAVPTDRLVLGMNAWDGSGYDGGYDSTDGGFIRNSDLKFFYDIYKMHNLNGIQFWPGNTLEDEGIANKWMLKTDFLKCQDNLPGANVGICDEWNQCKKKHSDMPLFDLLDQCTSEHKFPAGGGGGSSPCTTKCGPNECIGVSDPTSYYQKGTTNCVCYDTTATTHTGDTSCCTGKGTCKPTTSPPTPSGGCSDSVTCNNSCSVGCIQCPTDPSKFLCPQPSTPSPPTPPSPPSPSGSGCDGTGGWECPAGSTKDSCGSCSGTIVSGNDGIFCCVSGSPPSPTPPSSSGKCQTNGQGTPPQTDSWCEVAGSEETCNNPKLTFHTFCKWVPDSDPTIKDELHICVDNVCKPTSQVGLTYNQCQQHCSAGSR